MASVFEIQSFWKLKFQVDGDRGFLACLIDSPQRYESKYWLLLYRCTATIDGNDRSQLWVIRQQWEIHRWLRERCSLTKVSNKQIASQRNLVNGLELCWKEASAEIHTKRFPKNGNFRKNGPVVWICKACWIEHVSFEQDVPLQSSIISLAVSIMWEAEQTFITGFDLLSADTRINFGYRLPGTQVLIDIHDRKLRGFMVDFGKCGIHAIRPIFNTGDTSSWIGQPGGNASYKSVKLVLDQDIKAFSGKFDLNSRHEGNR
ncbi:hypothetical protein N7517_011308 [Penicillium concentricum]|uniref:DUF7600 domain-containing protein n=1 Tax=Penicillium concentricum TaxID=293559 RepID=A0A9W9RCA4_9EURO|nr:uncharacterized protein N7517_011308 [Penicillium concentricum]KAJ5356699.1 hypothetical protein N7517_011308 [Penicillium concentricum]